MKPVSSWKICAAVAILAAAVPAVAAEEFRWEKDLATAQRLARQTNRLVLIHFGVPWCGPCMMLERNVFSQPGFGRELAADYVAVKVDPDSSAEANAIKTKYGIDRYPSDVVTTPGGQLVVRMQSPNNAASYVGNLASIARQVLPERPAPAASQVASQPTSGQAAGGQTAARPADDRYAAYYDRQQPVEREPYQPPVQNRAGPASPPVEQAAKAPADRYADRYAGRSTDAARSTAADGYAASQDRYSPQQAKSSFASQGKPAQQVAANGDARYGSLAASAQGAVSQQSNYERNTDEPQVDEQSAGDSSSLEARLPPGSPPLALEGYCVVSLFENRKVWKPGDIKWGAIHHGMTYLFASQEAQQKFLANPNRYSPVCKGHDPVLVLDRNQAVQGRREFGLFYEDRVYLFANEETLQQFSQNPKQYSVEIMQAMRQEVGRR